MSKAIFICHRNIDVIANQNLHREKIKIKKILNRIAPDNIIPVKPYINIENGISIGIFNPTKSIKIDRVNLCLGQIEKTDGWSVPKNPRPEGSYSIFRSNHKYVELLTDTVASRTIWYIFTDNLLIASSSQRAIIMMLGNFKRNENVFSWMLSSGLLGPDQSWDTRLKYLRGNSNLLLDRELWKIKLDTIKISFSSVNLSFNKQKKMLKEVCEESINNLDLNLRDWQLLLSGGYDSRAVLMMLNNKENLKCINWGMRSYLNSGVNDSSISKKIAEYLNINLKFMEIDIADEPIETIINRFIISGEGRIDHIAGYMDGFFIWKSLFESGVQGVIRSDEAFGSNMVTTELEARRNLHYILYLSDYPNLKNIYHTFELPNQTLPDYLKRKSSETIYQWRDRLYIELLFPEYLAALTDLKVSYIEVANPFISKKIIDKVLTIPDNLRTDKILFKQIIKEISPNVPFTRQKSYENMRDTIKSLKMREIIYDEINTNFAKDVFSLNLINYYNKSINSNSNKSYNSLLKSSLKSKLKPFFPNKIMGILRYLKKDNFNNLNIDVFGFRCYLILRMNKILEQDAKLFQV